MGDFWIAEIELVPQEMRDEEAGLMRSRWFDYRHLTPTEATQRFADTYTAVYRETYAKTRDYRTADTVQPTPEVVVRSRDMIPLWRARQEADRVGCKYDFYLRFVFRRFWERGWRYLPRPNQLYSEEVTLDAIDEWRCETLHSLQLATDARFLVENYVGHPDQDAYHKYLIEQIARREHAHMALGRVLYREKMLPPSIAEQNFTADTISRAAFLYQ